MIYGRLTIAGRLHALPTEFELEGGDGGLVIRRDLNGTNYAVPLPGREALVLRTVAPDNLVMDAADAAHLAGLAAAKTAFTITIPGAGPTGGSITGTGICLTRPRFEFRGRGVCSYQFAITLL